MDSGDARPTMSASDIEEISLKSLECKGNVGRRSILLSVKLLDAIWGFPLINDRLIDLMEFIRDANPCSESFSVLAVMML